MIFQCTNKSCTAGTFEINEEGLDKDGQNSCPLCKKPCTRVLEFKKRKAPPDSSDSDSDSDSDSKPRTIVKIKRRKVEGVLPRCEFHTRLRDSTTFQMEESKYWDTYARSDDNRTHSTFDAPGVDTSGIKMGPYAKTGTYENVFSYSDPYIKLISLPSGLTTATTKLPPRLPGPFLYEASLEYRKLACRYIIDALQKRKCALVVNADNDYPCLLIQTPGGPTTREFPSKKDAKKLETNQKNWTRFVMAYLVGITNHLAWSRCLPIELVMRSSFGHLSPSVAECTISIRINVGIIPAIYADVLVDALELLEEIFSKGFKKKLIKMAVGDEYGELSEQYFLNILFRRAKKNNKSLKKEDLEMDLEKDGEEFVKDYYLQGKQRLPTRIGEAENLWEWLWSPGDASGKSVLTQIVDRNQLNLEGLADSVKQALAGEEDLSKPVESFPGRFKIDTKKADGGITLTPPKLPNMIDFSEVSIGELVVQDDRFWKLVAQVMTALGGAAELKNFEAARTVGGLYSCLEQLHLEFMQREGLLELPFTQDGYGSDSDEEDELEKNTRVYSKKIITATGMRAIHLAHHAGKLAAANQGLDVTNIKVICERMYYETEEALAGVPINLDLGKQVNGGKKAQMLIFDLNHCNNMQQKYPKVDFSPFDIVVLDHTSSTPSLVNTYMREAFRQKQVLLVLLVSSGLKNEQGGSDMNTYGTLRVMARNKVLRDQLYDKLKEAEGTYKHPARSHAARRAYKRKGFVPTTKSFLNPGFSGTHFAPPEPVVFTYQTLNGGTMTFDVVPIAADGDCLCSAIAEHVGGTPEAVRTTMVRQLEGHLALVPDGMYLQVGLGFSHKEVHSKEEYLEAIAQSQVWGGLPEIQAYSYLRPIVVFETPTHPRYFFNGAEVQPINWGALPQNVIYVAFYGNHYVALRRK